MWTDQGKAMTIMTKKPDWWTDLDADIGTKKTSQEEKISVNNLGREQRRNIHKEQGDR